MSGDRTPPTRICAICPGCGEVELTPPEEALEPRNRPALTWDDLLDLRLELESLDWWARLEAARARRDPAG
jgi:hypothetical protein